MNRYADRLYAATYEDDPPVGVYRDDPNGGVWVPERLFLRITSVARGYSMHLLPLLGGPEPVELTPPMIEEFLDEVAFVADRLNDELVMAWAEVLSAYAAEALRQVGGGRLVVEGS